MHIVYFLIPTYLFSYAICRYSYKSFLEYRQRVGIKAKYGDKTTPVIEAVSLTFVFMILLYSIVLDTYFEVGLIATCVLLIGLIIARGKLLYVHTKKKKDKGAKNYGYYLFEKPATYFGKAITIPPVSKYGKQDVEKLVRHNKTMEDSAPIIVQIIFLLITYGCTVMSFAYTGLFEMKLTLAGLIFMFFPFSLVLMVLGNLIFGFLNLSEKLFMFKVPEFVKYILFNLLFVTVLNLSLLFV